ncbi:hypothetical protein FD755_013779 [Muntiacus reevesi]|uniref:Uncharacterized protein n=1 Tax=Muntiacus reevesi TaxID=9886 RepID=A0A5N3XMZ3_MUNRE|nr:hypothetical protein FD755_013779 [Muntiacus reevesi]
MAPRKRGGRGISFIFCCFRNNDHPEITYRLRNDSNFALQTMEPALPMPPVEELDVMFSELVENFGSHYCSDFIVCISREKAYDFSESVFWKVEGEKSLARFDVTFK